MRLELELINKRWRLNFMRNKYLLTTIKILGFIILSNKITLAQNNMGISIETFLYTAQIENKYLDSQTSYESSFENNIGFSFPFTFQIADNYSLSLRPGLVFGSLYAGPHIVATANYGFQNRMYLLLGLNMHFNFYVGGHSKHGYSVSIPYVVSGFGYKIPEVGAIELQVHYSVSDVIYGYWRKPTERSSFYDSYYKSTWVIKLSFTYEWEL